ncbi:hypothetical protein FHS18_002975 [Paenibacillus phyllosphaerae]|uniref:DUF4446 family protein n=1 Tax=Paenibacillus phyllosphaerae TaxID=274593 RepID=A0A7W5FN82_9BACL|nr:DUF4446 family protein [Paenibacillus phyllosphaerae]MBB3110908.1 hypothetical protein [Paenibacillus phyllosphaerae]
MEEWTLQPMDGVTIGLAALVLILLIRSFVIGSKLKKLRKSYTQFMDGAGVEDLEQVILGLKSRIQEQDEQLAQLRTQLGQLSQNAKSKKGNVAVHRYNAFTDGGSNLSFSLAVLSDEEEGFVLSGLHNRETTYVYAKPVKQRDSEYPLTPEEKMAINLALKQES